MQDKDLEFDDWLERDSILDFEEWPESASKSVELLFEPALEDVLQLHLERHQPDFQDPEDLLDKSDPDPVTSEIMQLSKIDPARK